MTSQCFRKDLILNLLNFFKFCLLTDSLRFKGVAIGHLQMMVFVLLTRRRVEFEVGIVGHVMW